MPVKPTSSKPVAGKNVRPIKAGITSANEATDTAVAVRTEQEQRTAAVRDINASIAGLEERIAAMAESIGQSRDAISAKFTALDRQVQQADTLLRRQQDQLGELQSAQQELRALHEQLDNARREQGLAIEALALDTRRQFQSTRADLDALNQRYHEQQNTLDAYRRDHDALVLRTDRMQTQVTDVEGAVIANAAQTGRRFRIVGAAVGTLAVVSLGLIAWFQTYPTAVPEAVKVQLATLAGGAAEQAVNQDFLRAGVAAQGAQLDTLDAMVDAQANATFALRANARQLAGEVGVLRGEQAETRQDVTALRAEVRAIQAAGQALPTDVPAP